MNPIEFSRNLFELRTERRLSVEALAEALSVTPETICAWECAEITPTLEQSIRLAELYQIPLDEIVRRPRPRTAEPEAQPTASDPLPIETADALPTEETPSEAERTSRKRKLAAWEIVIVVLLLLILAVSAVFLIFPDLLPQLPPPGDTTAALCLPRSPIL